MEISLYQANICSQSTIFSSKSNSFDIHKSVLRITVKDSDTPQKIASQVPSNYASHCPDYSQASKQLQDQVFLSPFFSTIGLFLYCKQRFIKRKKKKLLSLKVINTSLITAEDLPKRLAFSVLEKRGLIFNENAFTQYDYEHEHYCYFSSGKFNLSTLYQHIS